MTEKTYTARQFILQVLNATGLGIVVALIPNAVLGTILKPLAGSSTLIAQFIKILEMMQSSASVLVGVAVAMSFNLNIMKTVCVTIITFIASGVLKVATLYTAAGTSQVVLQMKGVGDLINAIIFSGLSTYLMIRLKNGFGSLNIIAMPILACIIALIGYEFLPVVAKVTGAVAALIEYFTSLSPLVMAFLIGGSFALIVVSPLSSVVISIAVGLQGVNSGVAAAGICGSFALFCISGWKVNPTGVKVAVGVFGSVKMMVECIFRTPIINLPIFLNGAIIGVFAYFLNLQGNPLSAGFGYAGLVSPFAAYNEFTAHPDTIPTIGAIPAVIVGTFVVPWIVAFVVNFLGAKVFKLYTPEAWAYKIATKAEAPASAPAQSAAAATKA